MHICFKAELLWQRFWSLLCSVCIFFFPQWVQKQQREAKLVSQPMRSYMPLFLEVPTVSCAPFNSFYLLIEGALRRGEYSQMVTVSRSSWSNTWVTLKYSNISYSAVCVMVWLFSFEPHHRARVCWRQCKKKKWLIPLTHILSSAAKTSNTAFWKDLVVIR